MDFDDDEPSVVEKAAGEYDSLHQYGALLRASPKDLEALTASLTHDEKTVFNENMETCKELLASAHTTSDMRLFLKSDIAKERQALHSANDIGEKAVPEVFTGNDESKKRPQAPTNTQVHLTRLANARNTLQGAENNCQKNIKEAVAKALLTHSKEDIIGILNAVSCDDAGDPDASRLVIDVYKKLDAGLQDEDVLNIIGEEEDLVAQNENESVEDFVRRLIRGGDGRGGGGRGGGLRMANVGGRAFARRAAEFQRARISLLLRSVTSG